MSEQSIEEVKPQEKHESPLAIVPPTEPSNIVNLDEFRDAKAKQEKELLEQRQKELA